MENRSCNRKIRCSVDSCAYHNKPNNCCSLESIQIGCCGCDPKDCEGTECASFQLGSSNR